MSLKKAPDSIPTVTDPDSIPTVTDPDSIPTVTDPANFLAVEPATIPNELKRLHQWVLWQAMPRGGKITKVPYNATGRKARVNDAGDFTDYATVLKTYEESNGRFTGIGFVLTAEDGLVGVDIDKIINPSGKLSIEKLPENIKNLIVGLDTYTEISPSGTGLRAFAFGKLPKSGRKRGHFEFYESGRFLTVTGHHLKGTPSRVGTKPAEILTAHSAVFRDSGDKKPPKVKTEKSLADDEISHRMLRSASGPKIQQLLSGDFSGYSSQSEADLALCAHLSFWFNRDAGRVDAIFRSSGLYRPKWDEKHNSDGSTYGQGTIDRAIAKCVEVYNARQAFSSGGPENSQEKKQSDAQFLKEYKKVSEPDEPQMAAAKAAVVRILNKKFAAILIDGKFMIILEYENPITKRNDISYLRKQDFLSRFENRIIITGWGKGKPVFSTWAQIWIKSPHRREFDGLVFDTSKNSSNFYNLYRKPVLKTGPGTCELYLEHVEKIICGGDSAIFLWVLDWMAWLVQKKGKQRPGTAVVIRGAQGTGKGTFAEPFGQIFGDHYLHITQQNHFCGRFSEHFKNVILAFVDEALWAGDRKSEGHIKGLITEPTILIEPKFVNAYPIQNHVNFLFASNSPWIVPTGLEERRFLALNVLGDRQRDYAYFAKIKKEMKTGGVADLAKKLMARKVVSNLREAPRTEEFLSQAIETMEPEQQFWYHCLQEGNIQDPSDERPAEGWPSLLSRDGLFILYKKFCDRINVRNRTLSHSQLQRRLQGMVELYGGPRKAFALGGKRFRTWRLPSLESSRKQLEIKLKYKIEWENDDEPPF